MLRDKFREFSKDTSAIGQERVKSVNALANGLIAGGHAARATVAEWKDSLNEAWADLLELLDTRGQVLAAAYELQHFLHGARQALARVQHKQQQLPDGTGRDLNAAEALQRRHCAYEHDIQALSSQSSCLPLGDRKSESPDVSRAPFPWMHPGPSRLCTDTGLWPTNSLGAP